MDDDTSEQKKVPKREPRRRQPNKLIGDLLGVVVCGIRSQERRQRVTEALERVGMAIARNICRANSRADSSSAWRWLAPSPSPSPSSQ
jgi:hypothetical protein